MPALAAAFSHCCCDAALVDGLWIPVQARHIKCCITHKGVCACSVGLDRACVCSQRTGVCVPPCWVTDELRMLERVLHSA
jgi:hypothetical protein